MFYTSGEMPVAEIQTFLNNAVPSCTAGYTCLKSYTENTYDRIANEYCTSPYTGVVGQTSANIIKAAANACGINPRVLLVLLQKEQNLVTSVSPSVAKFQRATGYACPDSGTCAISTLGFYNQVYKAAWQFKVYRYNPPRWRHQPGQVNQVYFHPNVTGCGTKPVFIENQATAGLYNYTPYTPNDSALNNMYGTGDACASYGNRNFWRIYTDWFGNPNGYGTLLQSAADNKVYVVTDAEKYFVPTPALLASLAAIGPMYRTSQTYLDTLPTSVVPASNLMKGADGTLYLPANGEKHVFGSCELVVVYGFAGPCGSPITVTYPQLAKFTTGAAVTPIARSSATGIAYHLNGVIKRAFQSNDQIITAAAGAPSTTVSVPQFLLDPIPSGPDYLKPGSAVQVVGSAQLYLAALDTQLMPLASADLVQAFGMPSTRPISPEAFAASTLLPGQLNLAVTCGDVPYIAGGGALYPVPPTSGLPVTVLDPTTCAAFRKGATAAGNAVLFRATSNGWVYYINAGTKRFMNGWAMVDAVNGAGTPRVIILATPATLNAIPTAVG